MNIEEFTAKFAECLSQTDPHLIKTDTEFRKLEEWGSMLALIVIAMVDADYGKTLTSEDLASARTVADLFATIKNK